MLPQCRRVHAPRTDLGHGVFYDLFARQIALVTDEQLVDALDGISVDLLQPLLDVGKGVCGSPTIMAIQGA